MKTLAALLLSRSLVWKILVAVPMISTIGLLVRGGAPLQGLWAELVIVNANVITPEEARQLAGEVFNREFKKISAPWVKQPVSLTLAGVPVSPEEQSALVGPEVASGKPAPGSLVPPEAAKRRRGAPAPNLAEEAERLLHLRDALRAAEARGGKRAFDEAKRGELETEVVRVPADELRSWFEPEAPR